MQEGHGEDADQHEGRSSHRVEEELGRRVSPIAVPPPADEEVHGHQDDLEAEEEDDQIQGAENAHHPGLQQQQPGVVGPVVVAGVHSQQGDRKQHASQYDQKQRDSVDTEEPLDAEVGDPVGPRRELHLGSL